MSKLHLHTGCHNNDLFMPEDDPIPEDDLVPEVNLFAEKAVGANWPSLPYSIA